MMRSASFWIPMTIFQVVFGLTIFALTRQYYLPDPGNVSANPTVVRQSLPAWPDPVTESDLAQLESSTPEDPISDDPAEWSRQADEFFSSGQYDRAAELYEQLLGLAPNNVDLYNNLGITLHYLGRSEEALGTLNEGVAVDPTHQRTWLTLGFVNGELGNTEQARAALTTAIQMGTDNKVGQSAERMLENLR
jgi:tetratricopeptide (TPR) repeat protein